MTDYCDAHTCAKSKLANVNRNDVHGARSRANDLRKAYAYTSFLNAPLLRSQVKNRVKIGAGAMVLGNIPLGNDVVVGAAAIVTIPINDGETVVGINRVLSKEQKQAAATANKAMDTWLYDI